MKKSFKRQSCQGRASHTSDVSSRTNEVYQTQEEIPFYAKQTRLVLKNCGHIDAEHIEDALAVGAYEAFEKAVV